MEERALDRRRGAPTDDREFVFLDRDLEALLVHAGHLELQRVAVGGLADAGRRSDELLGLAAVAALPLFSRTKLVVIGFPFLI